MLTLSRTMRQSSVLSCKGSVRAVLSVRNHRLKGSRQFVTKYLPKPIQDFGNSIKDLVDDYKQVRVLLKQIKTTNRPREAVLSRRECMFIVETTEQVRAMLPIGVFFMIPFIGYTAPLVGYFYPQLLPSALHTPEQQVKCEGERLEAMANEYRQLLQLWSETETGKDSSILKQALVQQGTLPNDTIRVSVLPILAYNYNYKLITESDLLSALNASISVQSLIPTAWMSKTAATRRVLDHAQGIVTDDRMLLADRNTAAAAAVAAEPEAVEAVEAAAAVTLTDAELYRACKRRGMNVTADTDPVQLKQSLEDWLEISAELMVESPARCDPTALDSGLISMLLRRATLPAIKYTGSFPSSSSSSSQQSQ